MATADSRYPDDYDPETGGGIAGLPPNPNGDNWFQTNAPSNDAAGFVNDLASKYGIGAGETDIANLAGKNPEDVAAFQAALERQYAQRASSNGGGARGAAAPSSAGGGFGGAPAAFDEVYRTPELPEWLKTPYIAPTWQGGDFTPPTMAQIQADPGYQVGLDAGTQALQRGAASRGSILNPGTQKALARFGTDYGTTKAGEVIGRAFETYKDRYGQFRDAASLSLSGRQQQENEFQDTVNNGLSAYNTRYRGYQDLIGNTRNAELDWWQRQQDLIGNNFRAAELQRPPA